MSFARTLASVQLAHGRWQRLLVPSFAIVAGLATAAPLLAQVAPPGGDTIEPAPNCFCEAAATDTTTGLKMTSTATCGPGEWCRCVVDREANGKVSGIMAYCDPPPN